MSKSTCTLHGLPAQQPPSGEPVPPELSLTSKMSTVKKKPGSRAKSKGKAKQKAISTPAKLLKKATQPKPAATPKAQPAAKTKKDDGSFELEQQFIMRMPAGPISEKLRNDVENGSQTLKDRLFIEIANDMRHGCIRYDEKIFKARLVDLPTIMESLKTTDRKTFYKTADVCQMLVCVSDDESSEEEQDKKPKDKEKKYMWGKGITPPLKNVKKKRFRKTMRKKHPEQPEIEKEVKRLLRMDNEAIDVKYEVVYEEENANQDSTTQQVIMQEEGSKADPSNSLGLEHDIFGGEVSSSDEEDEKDINIMDSGDETIKSQDLSFKSVGDESNMSNLGAEMNAEANELSMKLPELQGQLESIRDRRYQKEMEIEMTNDSTVRNRLQNELDKIVEEENEKERETEILSAMVDQ